MVKVNKRLTSTIINIIKSDSKEKASVKVKSIVKFIKSNKY